MSSDRNFWRGHVLYIDNQNHRFVRKFGWGLSDRGFLPYFWSAIFHPKIFSVRMAGKGLNIFTFLEKIAAPPHASFLLQTHASLASKNRALFSLTNTGVSKKWNSKLVQEPVKTYILRSFWESPERALSSISSKLSISWAKKTLDSFKRAVI